MKVGDGFESREVSWMLDGIKMNATLTLPKGNGRHPGIVIVAGSGPTDRNWCSPLLPGNNGSGKLVAEMLASRGYATIRYDKRASGDKRVENARILKGKMSMKSHIDELVHAIDALLSSGNVDTDLLFAFTNSEGAIHALNYVNENYVPRFRGLVLTGVPGRKMPDVTRNQIEALLGGVSEKERLLVEFDKLIEDFSSGKEVSADASLPQPMQLLIASLSSPYNLPFSRELWLVDVESLISSAGMPMLLLIGKKDIQVDWEADGGVLEKIAAERNDITLYYPENANHVLKLELSPRTEINPQTAAAEYNADGRILDSDAMEYIIDWLDVESS